MKAEIRDFLHDLSRQYHNDYVSGVDIQKGFESREQERRWEREAQERSSKEKAKAEIYQRGEVPQEDKKAREEGISALLEALKPGLQSSVKESVDFWEHFNSGIIDKEEKEVGERLIEIFEERVEILDWKRRETEAGGNTDLAECYKKEKEATEERLKVYREMLKKDQAREEI